MCDIFGGGGDSGGTQTVNNVTKLPAYIEQGGENLFNQAKGVAGQPYQPYTLPRIADFSANQKQAIYNASENAGSYEGALGDASNLVKSSAAPTTDMDLSAYMNPYAENVLGTAQRKLEEGYQKDLNDLDAKAVAAGALGSDREGIVQGELARDKNQAVGDLYLQGMSNAYDNALTAYNADRDAAYRAGGGLSSIETTRSNLRGDDMGNLLTTGELARSLPQSSLDLAYQDFQQQQQDPYEELNWLSGILSAQPYSKQTTQTSTGGGSSGAGNLLGGALGAAALYSMFK